jgi:geranylgeranyl pyrophosphate synthase
MRKFSAQQKKSFDQRLTNYKKLIDLDIDTYSSQLETTVENNFGLYVKTETDAFLQILSRGGKRLRGSLVLIGYEMSGGKNQKLAVFAARAIEMLHSYMLIIDDIQDKSETRRGGKAAHVLLEGFHKQEKLAGDSKQFGLSVAINSAISGGHAAQMVINNLPTDDETKVKLLGIINRTMMVTAHGQTVDLFNQAKQIVDNESIERVLELKTAHYSVLNPLHVGMVLAGADCLQTDAITEYAIACGKAFQITDDIIGIFGDEQQTGKSPMDDIKEGKVTVLTNYAICNSSSDDKNFLLKTLGNSKLTRADFNRCKQIISDSGALKTAQDLASSYIEIAVRAITSQETLWNDKDTSLLVYIAQNLAGRKT